MTIDEARNYLYSSGMSDEQVRTVEGGFICGVLQEIRKEIEKPLRDERCYDTADAKAQYIALNWVCELIDKHIKQIEGSDTE